MTNTTVKKYWSSSLGRAVTVPEDDERPRIDELVEAVDNLLVAIQLTGMAPADQQARAIWNEVLARATLALQTVRR
jgi:hypothetical protein